MANQQQTQSTPPFREALAFWWKLGWISFGGTASHLAIMHEYLVERRRWVSNALFLHTLSLCMMLPGPEATQLAIYLGWRLHGKKGGIAAGVLFLLPATCILLALSIIYVRFGNLPWITAVFAGLRPAVVALVIVALLRMSGRALQRPLQWAVATAAFAAMVWLHLSPPMIMLCAIPLGLLVGKFWPQLVVANEEGPREPEEKAGPRNHWLRSLRVVLVCLLLWALPLPLLYLFGKDFSFWRQLSLFFTRAAFITVGGSYTILPYVAQVAVNRFQWLSGAQMLDGFALAETTPGPLIIVVGFVGFMAGFNHFNGSITMATIALLLTTFYTFLPCYLFVFAGAPLVERTRGLRIVEAVLKLIMAVVVAAILDLALFLCRGVIVHTGHIEWTLVIWIAIVVLLLRALKWNMMFVIALSVAVGLARAALHF